MPGRCHEEANAGCGSGCGHDHSDEREGALLRQDPGAFGVALNAAIDVHKVVAWNCQETNAAVAAALNPDACRAAPPAVLRSDSDEELLIFVPFVEFVRIRGIGIIGGGESNSPSRCQLFANRSDVTGFDSIRRIVPCDSVELAPTSNDTEVLYAVNATRFMNTASVTLFFDRNFGADETHVRRIIFYGTPTKELVNRPLATNVVYELRALPSDHPSGEDERLKTRIIR